MRIRISWPAGSIEGNLNDTATANKVSEALPVQGKANTWGDEVYFTLAINTQLEADAAEVVDPGTICYWVQGTALALPFGPTPVSERDECRLVTAVNVLGKLDGDPKVLGTIQAGDTVSVEAVE